MYTFTKDLETGNMAIDSQHRELINALNKLLEACSQGKGRAQIKDTAGFLLSYTKRHFADEELLQRQSGYPDFVNHKRYHEEFTKTVAALAKELETKEPDIVMVGKINSVIAGWLINHIKREDAKVAQHIRSVKK